MLCALSSSLVSLAALLDSLDAASAAQLSGTGMGNASAGGSGRGGAQAPPMATLEEMQEGGRLMVWVPWVRSVRGGLDAIFVPLLLASLLWASSGTTQPAGEGTAAQAGTETTVFAGVRSGAPEESGSVRVPMERGGGDGIGVEGGGGGRWWVGGEPDLPLSDLQPYPPSSSHYTTVGIARQWAAAALPTEPVGSMSAGGMPRGGPWNGEAAARMDVGAGVGVDLRAEEEEVGGVDGWWADGGGELEGADGGIGLKATMEVCGLVVPPEFVCPITMEVMTEPVILTDGHVYERAAIRRWLASHSTSPVTNKPVVRGRLIPCHPLRAIISDFVDHYRRSLPPPGAASTTSVMLSPPPPPPLRGETLPFGNCE